MRVDERIDSQERARRAHSSLGAHRRALLGNRGDRAIAAPSTRGASRARGRRGLAAPFFAAMLPLVAALPSLACNAVLGIHQTLDTVWDGGPVSAGGDTGDGSPGSFEAGVAGDSAPIEGGAAIATWANWPMPSPPSEDLPYPQAYDTSTPGVVLDKVTGLQWQRALDTSQHTWNDAKHYCSSLAVATGGGWRLPARIELLSIVDYSRVTPAIDPAAFPSTPGDAFWTSSPLASDPTQAWLVYFGFGTSMVYSDDTGKPHYVRCVR